ncbi:MAG: hypothetical protein ACPGLV_01315 [Bacteroidia bacterium]
MRVVFIYILLFLLITQITNAQSDTIRWQWGVKLTWDDFKEEPDGKKYDWTINQWKTTSNLNQGKAENPKIQITIYMNRATSWVKEHAKTLDNLERLNHIFNLYELGARKARFRMDSIVQSGGKYNVDEAEEIIRRSFEWYEFLSTNMANDYNSEERQDFRFHWRNKIDSLFDVYRDYNRFVLNKTAKVGGEYDFQFGATSWNENTAGLLKRNPNFHFSMSAGFVYQKLSIGGRWAINTNSAQPEFINRLGIDLADSDPLLSQGEIQLYAGTRLFQTERLGASLFIGGGSSYIEFLTANRFWAWCYTPSIAFDWDFVKQEKKLNKNYHYNLRFRVDYSVANFFDYYNSRLLTFSVGLSGFGYGRRYGMAKTPERYRGMID